MLKRLLFMCVLLLPYAVSHATSVLLRIDLSSDEDTERYRPVWDSVYGRFFAYRDSDNASRATARMFRSDGTAVDLYVQRDVPRASAAAVWDMAATGDGGAVLAASVAYAGHRGGKAFLLTYDGRGRLARLWDTDPYHHHKVAVDGVGNVYALGHRHDAAGKDFPLLVKYSPAGEPSGSFLSTSAFPNGKQDIEAGPETGDNLMFIHADELVLYVAPTREVFRFSLDGKLLQRRSVATLLDNIIRDAGAGSAEPTGLAVASGSRFVMQLRLMPPADSVVGQSAVVVFGFNGNAWRYLWGPSGNLVPGQLLGSGPDGQVVFLEWGLNEVRLAGHYVP